MESLDRIFLVQTVMFFRPSLKTNTRGKALLEKRQPSSTILLLAKSTNAVGPLLRRLPLRPNHNGVSIPGVSTFTKFMNMCNFSDSSITAIYLYSVYDTYKCLSMWCIKKRHHSWVIFQNLSNCHFLCGMVRRFYKVIVVTFRTHKLMTYHIIATCDHIIRLLLLYIAENAIKDLQKML